MEDLSTKLDVSPSILQKPVGRRAWIRGAASLAGSAAAVSLTPTIAEAAAQTSRARPSLPSTRPLIAASDKNAVADTIAGKVRGYTRNGIHTFKGIPYAATTEGAARFMPPA
jgi:para-nitrobenzyl esterase